MKLTAAMFRLLGSVPAAVVAVAFLAGCGDGSSGTTGPDPAAQLNQEQLKERLKYVAETGTTGSALAGMREEIQKTGKPDLEKDYARLEKAKSPAEAKKIAQEMLGKL